MMAEKEEEEKKVRHVTPPLHAYATRGRENLRNRKILTNERQLTPVDVGKYVSFHVSVGQHHSFFSFPFDD